MALVFLTTRGGSGAAISCAEKIAEAVLKHNETTKDDARINVRMGIHSGNVVQMADINDHPNVAGEGINTAQRVMDCGDVGHILLSDKAFHFLPAEPDRTDDCLPLGNVKVKHDQEVNIYNLCHDQIGNRTTPEKVRLQIENALEVERIKTEARTGERRRQRRLWALAIALFGILAALLVFVPWAIQTPDSPPSLAVLPFKPQTPGKYSSRAISKGLTEDFIRGFRFLASSQTAKPRYELRGTVESNIDDANLSKLSDDEPSFTVEVYAELYDTQSQNVVWRQKYTPTTFKKLIALEDSVFKAVCDAIKVPANKNSDDDHKAKAHWDYLVGRFWAFQRIYARGDDKKDFTQRATRKYEAARDRYREPYYALALAGLADISLSEGGAAKDPKNASKKALEYALQAAETTQSPGEEVAEPYSSIGTAKWWLERDFPTARLAFQLAIKQNPNLADSHKRYSNCLAALGKVEEAKKAMERALELEPESPIFQLASGQNHYFARQFDEAIGQLEKLISNDTKKPNSPAYRFLAMALEQKEQWQKALDLLEKLGPVDEADSDILAVKARVLVRLNRMDEASRILKDLQRLKKEKDSKIDSEYVSPYNIAVIYAAFPDKKDLVLEWLRKALNEYDPRVTWLMVDPRFKEWRDSGDVRFTALLQEAGLIPQPENRASPLNVARR